MGKSQNEVKNHNQHLRNNNEDIQPATNLKSNSQTPNKNNLHHQNQQIVTDNDYGQYAFVSNSL